MRVGLEKQLIIYAHVGHTPLDMSINGEHNSYDHKNPYGVHYGLQIGLAKDHDDTNRNPCVEHTMQAATSVPTQASRDMQLRAGEDDRRHSVPRR